MNVEIDFRSESGVNDLLVTRATSLVIAYARCYKIPIELMTIHFGERQ